MHRILLQNTKRSEQLSFLPFDGEKSDNYTLGTPKYSSLITYGYLRQNSVNPKDIATIVARYVAGQQSCIIGAHITRRKSKKGSELHKRYVYKDHPSTLIVFYPNLFQMHKLFNLSRIKIDVLHRDCIKERDGCTNGIAVGIISVDKKNLKATKLKTLKTSNMISNGYNFNNSSSDNNCNNDDEEMYPDFTKYERFDTINKQFESIDADAGNVICSYIILRENHGWFIGVNFSPVKAVASKYRIKTGDSIDIKFDWDNNYAIICKNEQFDDYFGFEIPREGIVFKNGKYKLKFDQYNQYLAFSSLICSCRYLKGFEYRIEAIFDRD